MSKNKRVRNGLLEGKENAIISKDLVTIIRDVPLLITTWF